MTNSAELEAGTLCNRSSVSVHRFTTSRRNIGGIDNLANVICEELSVRLTVATRLSSSFIVAHLLLDDKDAL